MWTDVVDLHDFYATHLGRVARRVIRRRIRTMWPDVKGQTVLGLGYAVPYLRVFSSEARRAFAFMPAPQGVLHWPSEGNCRVALTDELELPLPDLSVDKVMLVHALEYSEQLRPMLREAWRVLAGDGRLLVVVPNRRGIWARLERTPFGHGHPYSAAQLSRLLRDTMFTPLRTERALFVPPVRYRMVLATAPFWEQVGGRWFQPVSGVVVIEAGKQLYATTGVAERSRARRPIRVVAGTATASETGRNSAARRPARRDGSAARCEPRSR